MATKGGHTDKSPIEDLIEELTPLDAAIIDMAPDDGAKLGYHWLAVQVPTIVAHLNKDTPTEYRVTSAQVAGRIQTLATLGLLTRRTVQPTQQGKGIQSTPRGRMAARILNEQ